MNSLRVNAIKGKGGSYGLEEISGWGGEMVKWPGPGRFAGSLSKKAWRGA